MVVGIRGRYATHNDKESDQTPFVCQPLKVSLVPLTLKLSPFANFIYWFIPFKTRQAIYRDQGLAAFSKIACIQWPRLVTKLFYHKSQFQLISRCIFLIIFCVSTKLIWTKDTFLRIKYSTCRATCGLAKFSLKPALCPFNPDTFVIQIPADGFRCIRWNIHSTP